MNTPVKRIQRKQSLFFKLVLITFVFTTLVIPSNMVVADTDICDHWAEKSITRWQNCGIVSGYPDGSFRPNAYMTKAEFITILNHIYGFYETESVNYTDVQSSDWFYNQVLIAKGSPYMSWYLEDSLNPNDRITRQEVCAMIASIQNLEASNDFIHLLPFRDTKNMDEWSKAYLDASVSNGYLTGYPDMTLRPQDFITRAEVMAILDKSTGRFIYQSGIYGADEGSEICYGNLTINIKDVSLKNMIIKGNLILAAGIMQGNVDLTNVTVEGKTIINGGGEHSITFTNSHLGELLVYKQDGRIHVVSSNSSIGKTILMSSASLLSGENSTIGAIQIIGQAKTITLDGNYDQISLETSAQVSLTEGSEIGNLEITATGSNSLIAAGTQSKIGKITFDGNAKITGEGSIGYATINVNGVTIEQPVEHQEISNNVTDNSSSTPINSNADSGGGSSGGGGFSGGSGGDSSSDNNPTVPPTPPVPVIHQVDINQLFINSSNENSFSFHFIQAEVSSTYTYTIYSSNGGTTLSGNGTILNADQEVSGIDVSTLPDGILTLTVQLTTPQGSIESNITDTILKDLVAPTGYGTSIDIANVNMPSSTAFSFTLSNAEINATCYYTISSDGGGADVTGNTIISSVNQQISNIDVSSLLDGTLTLSVVLTDVNSNAGISVTDTVIKDTTAPSGYSITIDQPHIDTLNENMLSFTFNGAEVGTAFEYNLTSSGGTEIVTNTGTVTNANQQILGIDTSSLHDGTLTLSVRLQNAALNVGIASTDTVIKDTTAPNGYSISVDQNHINASNVNTLSFTFNSAELGSQFEYDITSDNGPEIVTDTGLISSANQQISGIDVSSLVDGTLTINTKLTDAYNNIGSNVTTTVSKDIIAPVGYTASIDIVNVDNTNNTNFTFTLSGAEIGTTCVYTISSDGGGTDITGNTTITSADQQITGIDVSALADGTLTLSIILMDTALNSGIASTDTVTKDADPPTGYSLLFDQGQINASNQNTVSFTFSGAEVTSTYEYTLISSGGPETLTGSGTISSENQQLSGIDVTSLAEGTLTLTAKLTDTVGHVGGDVTDTVFKDTLIPNGYVVTIDPARINTTNITAFAFTLSGAEVGTTCAYTISSDGGGSDITGSTLVTSTDQQISNIDVSTITDGTLTLSVLLTDTSLNSGIPSTDTVIKDVTPPSGYSLLFYQSNIHPQNQTAITLNFANAEIGTVYAYTLSSNNGGTPLTGTGTISTATDQISGLDTSGFADGILTLSCTLTDSDNNVGMPFTTTVRKSPYADLLLSGYDIVYGNGGEATNVAGDGTYIFYQMENGKPSYICQFGSETFILHWSDNGFGIEWNTLDTELDSYYFIESDTPLPPTNGWKYTNAINTVDTDFSIIVVTP